MPTSTRKTSPDVVAASQTRSADPPADCRLCPRLAEFRDANRLAEPQWFNAPVPSFGPPPGAGGEPRVLVVGLAPGLKGANRTGRPFTGDYAGDLLYETLLDYGFAHGCYGARPDDGLTLSDCKISNAVRCVPPQNKPTPSEIATCCRFLRATVLAMPRLAAIVALGRIAHDATLKALQLKQSAFAFAHGAAHALPTGAVPAIAAPVILFDSFHCSRYNTNTGRLTRDMFRAVFATVRQHVGPGGVAGTG